MTKSLLVSTVRCSSTRARNNSCGMCSSTCLIPIDACESLLYYCADNIQSVAASPRARAGSGGTNFDQLDTVPSIPVHDLPTYVLAVCSVLT